MTRSTPMPDKRVVTFKPHGDGYGTVSANWEDEPRETPNAEWAVKGFAEGWKAELVVGGKW